MAVQCIICREVQLSPDSHPICVGQVYELLHLHSLQYSIYSTVFFTVDSEHYTDAVYSVQYIMDSVSADMEKDNFFTQAWSEPKTFYPK